MERTDDDTLLLPLVTDATPVALTPQAVEARDWLLRQNPRLSEDDVHSNALEMVAALMQRQSGGTQFATQDPGEKWYRPLHFQLDTY